MINFFMLATWVDEIDPTRMLIGLLVGVILLIVLVTMTRVHAFLSILLAAMTVAIVGGVPGGQIPGIITSGFGGTLGSIGIIIGLGVIMGKIFEVSGAAETMARSFIKLFGKGREELALAVTGFIVSIPIFCDSAFVILFPIAKAISQKTRKNLLVLAGALAIGLGVTHTLVPPTPGPLFVAEAFGVEIGTMIFWGILTGIPMTIAAVIYIRWVGRNIVLIPNEEGVIEKVTVANVDLVDLKLEKKEGLPSAWMSFAPIFIPIFFILVKQVWDTAGTAPQFIEFIGNPVVSVSLGTLVAIYGLGLKTEKSVLMDYMDAGIRSAGIILLVTGAGGALGNVIKVTGVGNSIADAITTWGLPAILLPFIIATLVRFIQGSGTVSLITAASISAPIIALLDVNPVFAALSAMIGGLFFSYFNDSYFHVINRSLTLKDPKKQMLFWSGATTVSWVVGIITVLIFNLFFGGIA
ncbi:MAG: GntP family permease [Candidatus Izemoplasmataceae bacterium]